MIRKIKPQRAQRITESCYFHLSPPLCHSVSSVVFRNFISKISKVSGGLVTATRDTKDPQKIEPKSGKDNHSNEHPIEGRNLRSFTNAHQVIA